MHFVCIGSDCLTMTRRPMDLHSPPIAGGDSVHFVCTGTGPQPCESKSYTDRHYSQELRLPSIQLRERCGEPRLMGGCDLTTQQEERE